MNSLFESEGKEIKALPWRDQKALPARATTGVVAPRPEEAKTATAASVKRGLEQAASGETHYLGQFGTEVDWPALRTLGAKLGTTVMVGSEECLLWGVTPRGPIVMLNGVYVTVGVDDIQ